VGVGATLVGFFVFRTYAVTNPQYPESVKKSHQNANVFWVFNFSAFISACVGAW
jgi:hypothetical protein